MAKDGGNAFERGVSSCLTGVMWLFFIGIILVVVYMTVVFVGGPQFAPDLLDVFSTAPASYKEARSHAKKGQHELAIQKFNEFLRNDAKDVDESMVVQAHLDAAEMYRQMVRNLSYSDPQYKSKTERWCTKGMEHCDAVLRIKPGHRIAEERKTLLAVLRG